MCVSLFEEICKKAVLHNITIISGGGLASDEDNLTLPMHTTDLNSFRSQLAYLTYIYGIETVSI